MHQGLVHLQDATHFCPIQVRKNTAWLIFSERI